MNEQKKKVSLWILGIITIILIAVIVVLIVFLINKNNNEKKLMDQVKDLTEEKAELETKTESVNEKIKNIQGQLNEIAGEKNNETVEENKQVENNQENDNALQSFSGEIVGNLIGYNKQQFKKFNVDINAVKNGSANNGYDFIKYEVMIEGNKVTGIEDVTYPKSDYDDIPNLFITDVIWDKNDKDCYLFFKTIEYNPANISAEIVYIIDTKGNIIHKIYRRANVSFGLNNNLENEEIAYGRTFRGLYASGEGICVIDNYYVFDCDLKENGNLLEVVEHSIENGKVSQIDKKDYLKDEFYGAGAF